MTLRQLSCVFSKLNNALSTNVQKRFAIIVLMNQLNEFAAS